MHRVFSISELRRPLAKTPTKVTADQPDQVASRVRMSRVLRCEKPKREESAQHVMQDVLTALPFPEEPLPVRWLSCRE